MPLVAIPEALEREVEGHAMGLDWGWATPLYGVTGNFDGWRPPRQSMNSRFWSVVGSVVGGGRVYHVFVSRLCVLRVP